MELFFNPLSFCFWQIGQSRLWMLPMGKTGPPKYRLFSELLPTPLKNKPLGIRWGMRRVTFCDLVLTPSVSTFHVRTIRTADQDDNQNSQSIQPWELENRPQGKSLPTINFAGLYRLKEPVVGVLINGLQVDHSHIRCSFSLCST